MISYETVCFSPQSFGKFFYPSVVNFEYIVHEPNHIKLEIRLQPFNFFYNELGALLR